MAETISQRVNALFASYVATEAEQRRLGELGTDEAGKQADALGAPALAIRDEVFAIRDRSACPDLVAARILLDLMLSHQWPPTSETEWGEDADVALPMLEILADRVTGDVRIETRRALATIGVDVPAEQADPFVERMRRYHADVDAYNNSGRDDDVDPWHAFESEVESGAVIIGSAAGAAEALRQVVALDAVGCIESELWIAKVLAFLEGRV